MSELAVAPKQQITAIELLQQAVEHGADISVVERLAKLQREILGYEAEVAFNQALMRAQGSVRRVGFDKRNEQTRSGYVTYAKLDAAIRPIYTREGFALSFNTEPSSADMVRVICHMSHQSGHTRTYSIDMPADGKGAKGNDVMTKTHATGSAVSYGMRYLLKMIFNVSVGETDDDGNAAGKVGGEIPLAEFDAFMVKIENAPNPGVLFDDYKAAILAARKYGDKGAEKQFEDAKNRRKAAL